MSQPHNKKGGFYYLDATNGDNRLVQDCTCGHRHPMKENSGEPDTSKGWRESTKSFETLTKSGATGEMVIAFGTDRTVLAQ